MDRREFLAAAAAPLLLGAAPPAFARATGGTPVALVTADLESSIVVVDAPDGPHRPPARHAGRSAQHREIGGTGAVVAHTGAGRVSLVDSSSPSTRSAARSGRRATPRSPTTFASPTSPTRRARRWRSSTCAPAASSARSASAAPRATSTLDRARPAALGRARQQERRDRDRRLDQPRGPRVVGRDPAAVPRPRRRLQPGGAPRLGDVGRPRPRSRSTTTTARALVRTLARRRAAAARHLPRRPCVRDERRRRPPSRACARRPADPVGRRAGAARTTSSRASG